MSRVSEEDSSLLYKPSSNIYTKMTIKPNSLSSKDLRLDCVFFSHCTRKQSIIKKYLDLILIFTIEEIVPDTYILYLLKTFQRRLFMCPIWLKWESSLSNLSTKWSFINIWLVNMHKLPSCFVCYQNQTCSVKCPTGATRWSKDATRMRAD